MHALRRHPLAGIGDRHVTQPDHVELVAVNDNGRGFVDADAQQVGMRFDERNQVEFAIAPQDMLVDGGVFQEGEAGGVVSLDDFRSAGVAADQI